MARGWTAGLVTMGLLAASTGGRVARAADTPPPEPAAPAVEEDAPAEGTGGKTFGHVQLGLAVFDRTGTLADEAEARGFAPFGGGTLRLGFVHHLAAVPWLGFGASVRGTFGNSSEGDEGYYFNPIFTSATVAAHVPAGPRASGIDLAVDAGFTNILAKSRTEAEGGPVFHEYGIGPGVGLLAGYRLGLPGVGTALTLAVQHSRHWVGVDVDRGPSKTWALGVTSLLAGATW